MDSNYVDFNPDIMAGQILRGILNELVKCQGFFDDWAEQLVIYANQDGYSLERQLSTEINKLRDDCSTAIESSRTIIDEYQQFSLEMVTYLGAIALQNQKASLEDNAKTISRSQDHLISLADSLATHSLLVTEFITRIQLHIRDIVSTISARVNSRKKNSTFWSWLSFGLGVVTSVLTAASAICPILFPSAPHRAFSAASGQIRKGAQLCAELENESKAETERYETIADQLLATILRQAEEAEKSIASAQTNHEMVRIEIAFQMGQFEVMSDDEATKLRDMWMTQCFLLKEEV